MTATAASVPARDLRADGLAACALSAHDCHCALDVALDLDADRHPVLAFLHAEAGTAQNLPLARAQLDPAAVGHWLETAPPQHEVGNAVDETRAPSRLDPAGIGSLAPGPDHVAPPQHPLQRGGPRGHDPVDAE